MLKGGVTYIVVLKITCYDVLTLGNTYTTLNDTLNQRIPQYCQEYSDTHKCSTNDRSNYCIYYIQCM